MMTTSQLQEARLGRDYWQQYVKLNGYAFYPTKKGLSILARNLDLNIPHLQRCINRYLET